MESRGKKTAIIGCGPLLRELEKLIREVHLDVTLINAMYLNPVDKNVLETLLGYEQIVIYDPYSTRGGLVNLTMEYLLEKGFKGAAKAYFVPNEFVSQASINEQLEKYHLLPKQVMEDLK